MGLGQDGNTLVMLIAILAIVFCIFQFIWIVYKLSNKDTAGYEAIINWFILPADFNALGKKPWTLITYMFMHTKVWHMLGNLLWLWAFGYIFQDLTGNKKLIPLFLYGGVAGGLFFMLCYNLFPGLVPQMKLSTLQGASAGVMAIAIATTTLAPHYRIFPMINGGIPLWVLTVVYLIIDLASDPDKQSWKKTARTDLHYKTRGTQPYRKIPNITQKRIDEILDKINQQGYRFLTDEEKDILKRAAEDEEL
jgi:membrane associated rhomboid family serine protease